MRKRSGGRRAGKSEGGKRIGRSENRGRGLGGERGKQRKAVKRKERAGEEERVEAAAGRRKAGGERRNDEKEEFYSFSLAMEKNLCYTVFCIYFVPIPACGRG